jgi:hypothetical protein
MANEDGGYNISIYIYDIFWESKPRSLGQFYLVGAMFSQCDPSRLDHWLLD